MENKEFDFKKALWVIVCYCNEGKTDRYFLAWNLERIKSACFRNGYVEEGKQIARLISRITKVSYEDYDPEGVVAFCLAQIHKEKE